MMTPLPLHRLTPAAQTQFLEALHKARRCRPLCVTLRVLGEVFVAWWPDHRTVPTALYMEGRTPKGRVCPWPRREFRGTVGSFPGGLTAEGVDHEALAWAYEREDREEVPYAKD